MAARAAARAATTRAATRLLIPAAVVAAAATAVTAVTAVAAIAASPGLNNMQTVIGGSYSPGAALPAGMTEDDLRVKNLREANQVNALKFNGGGATAAFDSSGASTGGANTPVQSAGAGLLSSAIGSGSAKGGILASAEKPQTRPPEVATPPPSTPQQLGLPASWKITPDQTVEGRIGALTDPNNPFIQQARSRADGRSNERGLLNSSMALTAADSAAYDAAMPIAQADAANASKIAGYNTDKQNEFSLANLSNATNRYGIDTTASTQRYTAGLSADTQLKVKQLDGVQQAEITKLGNDNKLLIQNSNIGSNAYDAYAKTLYNNSVNKDMSPQARYQADQNAFNIYQQGIKTASSLLNVPDVSNLLIFTGVDPNAPPPQEPGKPVDGSITPPAAPPSAPPATPSGWPSYGDDANRF